VRASVDRSGLGFEVSYQDEHFDSLGRCSLTGAFGEAHPLIE